MVGHRRDAWAYSQSKSYWGRKPWAPDPCFRENVMYTGHLLQLLALYETLTGDTRYWTDGWDFVWTDGRRVQYTVRRLIDVTVEQMRNGPNGGVCCEPGISSFVLLLKTRKETIGPLHLSTYGLSGRERFAKNRKAPSVQPWSESHGTTCDAQTRRSRRVREVEGRKWRLTLLEHSGSLFPVV